MNMYTSISDLPGVAAVYAMYGGKDRGLYVAYVGVAGNLKRRLIQHLVRRDSSVATGTSAVMLNPDYVTQVKWWEHPAFEERPALEAAEIVAFEVFDPALRSRGAIQEKARQLFEDTSFREEMRALFDSEPSGQLTQKLRSWGDRGGIGRASLSLWPVQRPLSSRQLRKS